MLSALFCAELIEPPQFACVLASALFASSYLALACEKADDDEETAAAAAEADVLR